MNKYRRLLALVLALSMTLGMIPFGVFGTEAAEISVEETAAPVEETEVPAEETEAPVDETEAPVEETEAPAEETESPVEETEASIEETVPYAEEIVEAETLGITITSKPADGTGTNGEPFEKGTGGSNSFRIPALVTLSDGTLVAAADARWNTTYDGGGLDTIVSRSTDNGANWSYTFANYLGDNGNEYNGSGSTAFIDPALAVTSDDTIYMLVDLYPYGVALNGSNQTTPDTTVGFFDDNKLKLSKDDHTSYAYYLNLTDYKIYSYDGNVEDTAYTVDEYFNITGTDGTSSNLFFSDSPYKVVRTGFLYLTTSTDKGATWSAPTLLNLKTSSEMVCLVAPGRGLVTSTGMIVFPVYSFHGDNDAGSNTQRMSFIYSTDGTSWDRTTELNYNWASESAVVELSDGTLRFFYRNGTTNLCYVDYDLTNSSWGNPVVEDTIDTNSNTQISAITYSRTVGGKQVILVSCPTGSNSAGSNSSSGSDRLNGKIFIGLVNDDKTMDWSTTPITVDSTGANTINGEPQFMYSCLTELNNGKIALLNEDGEYNWGTSDDSRYTMSYSTYDLTLDFDETDTLYAADPDTDKKVTYLLLPPNGTQALNIVGMTDGETAEVQSDNTGVVTAARNGTTLTLTSVAAGTTHVTVKVTDTEGTTDTIELIITVMEAAEKNIKINMGDSVTLQDTTGNYTGEGKYSDPKDTGIATMDIAAGTAAMNNLEVITNIDDLVSGGQYLIVNAGTGDLLTDKPASVSGTWDNKSGLDTIEWEETDFISAENTDKWSIWTITASANASEYTIVRAGSYLTFAGYDAQMRDNETAITLAYTDSGWTMLDGYTYINVFNESNKQYYLNDGVGDGYTGGALGSTDTTLPNHYWKIYKVDKKTVDCTDITFTGVTPGTTTAVVGYTTYNITVDYKQVDVRIAVNETSETYTDDSGNYENDADNKNPDATIASMKVSGSEEPAAVGILLSDNSEVSLETCLYSFPKNDKGYYVIESVAYPGVYLNHYSTTNSYIPNCTTAGEIAITAGTGDLAGMFRLQAQNIDSGNGSARFLHFHREKENPYWNRCSSDDTIKCHEYLYRPVKDGEESSTEIPGYVQITSLDQIEDGGQYLIVQKNDAGNYYVLHPSTDSEFACVAQVSAVDDPATTTEITFTGVAPGETTAIVGNTQYNITVYKMLEVTINYQVDGTTVISEKFSIPSDEPTVTLPGYITDASGNTYKVDSTTLTVTNGTDSYAVPVTEVEGIGISVKERGSATLTMDDELEEGQTIVWTTADGSYVAVAPNYEHTTTTDADGATVTVTNSTNNATIIGYDVTDDPILVTGTVYNADGTVAATKKWMVTVEEADASTEDYRTVKLTVKVERIQNCAVYYSINGGKLIEIQEEEWNQEIDEYGNVYYCIEALIDESFTNPGYGVHISFFAAPDEGYALSYMAYTSSSGDQNQYFSISNGNPDGTGSDAWPFDAVDQSTIPTASDDNAWKNQSEWYEYYSNLGMSSFVSSTTNNCFGYGWALLQKNMTIDQWKVMMSDAIAKGCDGAMLFTKNEDNTSFTVNLNFVAQKLPEVEKTITGVTVVGATEATTYTDGMTLGIGDTIHYSIQILLPNYEKFGFGDIYFPSVELIDELTDDMWTTGASSGSVVVDGFTYTDLNGNPKGDGTASGNRKEIEKEFTSVNADGSTVTYTQDYLQYTFTTKLTLSASNFLSVVRDGKISNTVDMNMTYKSTYASGYAADKSTAVAEVLVEVPEYVIDFGLPVEIDLSDDPLVTGDIIVKAEATCGDVKITDERKVLYKPDRILEDTDFITLEFQDTSENNAIIGYGVRIYPATTVYYEEGFATYSDDWGDSQGAKGSSMQEAQEAEDTSDDTAANADVTYNNYGYDDAYASNLGASNGTEAVTSTVGSTATFTFTGTGVEIYANCTESTGVAVVTIKDASTGSYVKFYQVDTVVKPGTTPATADQLGDFYSLPIVSVQDLAHGTYEVTVRLVRRNALNGTDSNEVDPIRIDGFRVFGTIATDSAAYVEDEKDPQYVELRDLSLTHANVVATVSDSVYALAEDIVSQVYSDTDTLASVVVISTNVNYATDGNLKDLLDNGPKNEVYLYEDQAVTFTLTNGITAQIGLKAPKAATSYTISIDDTTTTVSDFVSSVDMFYHTLSGEVTITNTGTEPLSITLLKYFVEETEEDTTPLADLSVDQVVYALRSIGYTETPTTPDESEEADVTFTNASLSLTGDIGVNFYAKLSDSVVADPNARMVFTVNGVSSSVPLSEAMVAADGAYRFACKVHAKQMADEITAQMYISDGAVGEAKSYSAKAYCEAMLNLDLSGYRGLEALLKAMLNYGAAAQLHFGYNTGDLANASLSDADRELTIPEDLSAYRAVISGKEEGIEAYSASLVLESTTTIRFYFRLTGDKTIDEYTFTVNGETVSPVAAGGVYYVDMVDITAKNLDTVYTASVGGLSIAYSGLSYVYAAMNYAGTTETLAEVLRALYLYNQAANNYFGT